MCVVCFQLFNGILLFTNYSRLLKIMTIAKYNVNRMSCVFVTLMTADSAAKKWEQKIMQMVNVENLHKIT